MGKTSKHASAASATQQKGGPKKVADMNELHKTVKVMAAGTGAAAAESGRVDSKMVGRDNYEVVVHEGKAMSIYLNWADMKANHNKFYICQVLQRKGMVGDGKPAVVFIRYGRVGVDGAKSEDHMPYAAAIKTYLKKTREKTRKGYTEIKIAN